VTRVLRRSVGKAEERHNRLPGQPARLIHQPGDLRHQPVDEPRGLVLPGDPAGLDGEPEDHGDARAERAAPVQPGPGPTGLRPPKAHRHNGSPPGGDPGHTGVAGEHFGALAHPPLGKDADQAALPEHIDRAIQGLLIARPSAQGDLSQPAERPPEHGPLEQLRCGEEADRAPSLVRGQTEDDGVEGASVVRREHGWPVPLGASSFPHPRSPEIDKIGRTGTDDDRLTGRVHRQGAGHGDPGANSPAGWAGGSYPSWGPGCVLRCNRR
jgi:hypothetical protein